MPVPMYRSKAPLRVSFAGGGTDVSPYYEERGGAVLSATVDLFAYGTMIPTTSEEIEVTSLDFDIVAKYHSSRDLIYNGELDLVKAVIKRMRRGTEGMRLFIHCDAPPGSGMGSSSTMTVALVGLFKRFYRLPLTDYEIADLAYQIERKDLGIAGGKQDQYAAAFGGFNFIEFSKDKTVVNPLRVEADLMNELEYRLLLCYTGKTRPSSGILQRQIEGYQGKREEVVAALDGTKRLAFQMKDALLTGDLDGMGELLNEGWEHKRRFASGVSNDEVERIYEIGLKNGGLGGKLLGAGGGGFLLMLTRFDRKHKVAEALEDAGGQIVDFSFEEAGLQTWGVES